MTLTQAGPLLATDLPAEVRATARKSRFSGSGNCVSVIQIGPGILAELPDGGRVVGDTKNPDGTVKLITDEQWDDIVARIEAGGLDVDEVLEVDELEAFLRVRILPG